MKEEGLRLPHIAVHQTFAGLKQYDFSYVDCSQGDFQ